VSIAIPQAAFGASRARALVVPAARRKVEMAETADITRMLLTT
jgi:hypothetical protein